MRFLTIMLAFMLVPVLAGCGKSKDAAKPPPPRSKIEKPQKKRISAAEQRANYFKSKQEVESNEAWGVQVATLAKGVHSTTKACLELYLSKLQPDELLVGKPALITTDGVVTVMDNTCIGLVDDFKNGRRLMQGKHPATEALLRQWSYFADLYARTSRIAVNIGASSKKRKLNHKALLFIQKELVENAGPKLLAESAKLLAWTASNIASPVPTTQTLSASEALKLWKGQTKSTAKEAMQLGKLWHSRGHDLLKKNLYARVRFLTWLGSAWKHRMTIERQKMQRTRSGNAEFDRAMGLAAQAFYDALATYHRDGFEVAMLAMKDKGTIDEPALKEGKKVLKSTAKAFQKAVRSIQWPKAP